MIKPFQDGSRGVVNCRENGCNGPGGRGREEVAEAEIVRKPRRQRRSDAAARASPKPEIRSGAAFPTSITRDGSSGYEWIINFRSHERK